jgi:hypothetical protein
VLAAVTARPAVQVHIDAAPLTTARLLSSIFLGMSASAPTFENGA